MNWILLSFLTAASEAAKDVFGKISLRQTNAYIVAWAYRLFSLPFLIPFLFFIEIPTVYPMYWVALLVGGILNVATSVLYMKAIEHSDLSITVPMVTLTPMFLLLTSPILIGEVPSFMGVIGVLLIVVGSYTLNISDAKKGFWKPLKSLVSDKGPRYMMAVAFIWSISSNFDKIGIQASSPMFWAITVNAFIALAMIPLVLVKVKSNVSQIFHNVKLLMPIGIFGALTLVFQMHAIELANVAYVISIKRVSVVLAVVAGYFIFKEKGFRNRLLGVILMLMGVVLISLFS
jgi:uncharacterized membrane protein